MTDPLHWLIAVVSAMLVGIPVIFFVTKLGVASGIRAFYKRLDTLSAEIHEVKGELEHKIDLNWNFIRTVNGNLGRLENRVSKLEGDVAGEE